MTETETNKRPLGTRWCGIGSFMAGLGLIAAAVGLLGAAVGALSPFAAFGAFGLGLLLCALATLVLLIGLMISKGSGGAIAGGRAWGAWLVAVLVIVVSVSQRPTVEGAQGAVIHDVSTSVTNAPVFVEIITIREAEGAANPPEYTGEFSETQLAAFPDIQTLSIARAPAEVFAAAEGVVAELGWEQVAADAASGRIEATASTPFFGFKDDVVIRISAAPNGSEVDIRSKSRVGQGDMGANAARIREFLTRLQAATG
ncbi:MAG: DUF1499 domain-containing protein [Gammaproteobacteria bacterium]